MFTYTPQGNRRLGYVILGASPVLGLAFVTVGLLVPGIWRHILFALALFFTAVGTTVAIRLQLPEYTYEISDADCPGQYDLVITSRLGKRRKTDCRVRVAGILTPYRKKKKDGPQYVLCCRLFPGEEKHLFLPEEAEGEYALVLCPSAEMCRAMQALGVQMQKG